MFFQSYLIYAIAFLEHSEWVPAAYHPMVNVTGTLFSKRFFVTKTIDFAVQALTLCSAVRRRLFGRFLLAIDSVSFWNRMYPTITDRLNFVHPGTVHFKSG